MQTGVIPAGGWLADPEELAARKALRVLFALRLALIQLWAMQVETVEVGCEIARPTRLSLVTSGDRGTRSDIFARPRSCRRYRDAWPEYVARPVSQLRVVRVPGALGFRCASRLALFERHAVLPRVLELSAPITAARTGDLRSLGPSAARLGPSTCARLFSCWRCVWVGDARADVAQVSRDVRRFLRHVRAAGRRVRRGQRRFYAAGAVVVRAQRARAAPSRGHEVRAIAAVPADDGHRLVGLVVDPLERAPPHRRTVGRRDPEQQDGRQDGQLQRRHHPCGPTAGGPSVRGRDAPLRREASRWCAPLLEMEPAPSSREPPPPLLSWRVVACPP